MSLGTVNKIIKFDDRLDLLKTLLYIKLSSKGISLPENMLYVLALFVNETDTDKVLDKALELKYINSKNAGNNAVSYLVKNHDGLLLKAGTKRRQINPEIFENVPFDTIAANYKIHNIN